MRDEKEFLILCDESDREGRFYSNFYGGVLVGGSQYEAISARLNAKKRELNFHSEVKWTKVTDTYLSKYKCLMTAFFEELREGRVKVRIMFTQNAWEPIGLTPEDRELGYFKLYYQFIKHAFGLRHIESRQAHIRLRIYLDDMPDTHEKRRLFKTYLHGLPGALRSSTAALKVVEQDVTEVRSHDHVLLQCLDVVLGAMCFRLNDKHKDKPPGQRLRGKRTIAKEKLYTFIRDRICEVMQNPRFNVGDSTGFFGDRANTWRHPYRHWKFKPSDVSFNQDRTK